MPILSHRNLNMNSFSSNRLDKEQMVYCQLLQVDLNHSLNIHMLGNVWSKVHEKSHDKQSKKNYLTKNKLTYLNSSVLNLSCNFGCKLSHWLLLLSKVRMMSCITLDANSPRLLGHSEYKSPSFFWIKVGVCQDQETLVLFQTDILFKIIENQTSMKLSNISVRSNSRLYYTFII